MALRDFSPVGWTWLASIGAYGILILVAPALAQAISSYLGRLIVLAALSYGHFGLMAAHLYGRIAQDDVLKSGPRKTIMEEVGSNPGSCEADLVRVVPVGASNAALATRPPRVAKRVRAVPGVEGGHGPGCACHACGAWVRSPWARVRGLAFGPARTVGGWAARRGP